MIRIVFTLLICICANLCMAQMESVPWAEKAGKWTVPIYFEDGTGARDTFYVVYHPDADGAVFDSIYGEYFFSSDDSSFQACAVGCVSNYLRAFVTDQIFGAYQFNFSHAVFPIEISTRPSVLYTDSLPLALDPTVPQVLLCITAEGFAECDTISFATERIYITDTLTSTSRCGLATKNRTKS